MVAGTDRDAVAIENGSNVVRVDSIHDERNYAGLLAGGADQSHSRNRGQRSRRMGEQGVLVPLGGRKVDGVQVIDGSAEADNAGDVGGPCFEFIREVVVRRFLKGDGADHVAAALPRRHFSEQRGLAIEYADAGWTEDLVAGEYVEIAIEFANVHGQMRNRLGAVDQNWDAALVGQRHKLADWNDGAQRVRHVCDGD